MSIRFHERTFALLPDPPKWSAERWARLAEREQQLGRAIPESVKEWYSLDNAEHALQRHYFSDENRVCRLERLGDPVGDLRFEEPCDFVRHGLLCFADEGPLGAFRTALLDADDPAVVLVKPNVDIRNPFRPDEIIWQRSLFLSCPPIREQDAAARSPHLSNRERDPERGEEDPHPGPLPLGSLAGEGEKMGAHGLTSSSPGDSPIVVLPSAVSFSTFVFCHIWSNLGSADPRWHLWWGTCDRPVSDELEQALRDRFLQLPTTYNEFGNTTLRFQLKNARLTIYTDRSTAKGSDWTLQAMQEESMRASIEELSPYHTECPVHFELTCWPNP